MTITEGTSTPATTRPRSATPKSSTGEYITDHFVRRLIRERRIPFVKVGRLVRLRRTDIDDYLAGRLVPAVRR